jgi:hypothetical protein
MMARASEVNMKRTAAMVVALERTVAAPRLPRAVWLPPPPKAPARSAPFPDWRRTTMMRIRQTIIWRAISAIIISSLSPDLAIPSSVDF